MLWPLLAHVLGPAGGDGGALLEEGLRLLGAALAASPALPPELPVRRSRGLGARHPPAACYLRATASRRRRLPCDTPNERPEVFAPGRGCPGPCALAGRAVSAPRAHPMAT